MFLICFESALIYILWSVWFFQRLEFDDLAIDDDSDDDVSYVENANADTDSDEDAMEPADEAVEEVYLLGCHFCQKMNPEVEPPRWCTRNNYHLD